MTKEVDKRKFAKFYFSDRVCKVCSAKFTPVSPKQIICSNSDIEHINFRKSKNVIARKNSYEKIGKHSQKYKRERRLYWLRIYKIKKGCCECGYNKHSLALDFNHIDPRLKQLNIARNVLIPLTSLISEIRKCEILCSNCHRIKTFEQNIYYSKRLNK